MRTDMKRSSAPVAGDNANGNALGRRRFLRLGLFGAALLGAAGVLGRNVGGYAWPEGAAPPKVLSQKELLVLAAAVARLVAPDADDAPPADALAIARFIDDYLGNMDVALRRDVSALLQLLEHGSSLFRLRATRFTHMDTAEQDRTLDDWADSGLAVRRQGFQGLRALAFLGYYRDDRTFAMLGYAGPMVPRAGLVR